ncbi:MAG: hypothetical protein GWN58_17970, partial [Anaerolineae bacterium]|nr:hypothetical protein [Anaerolineae bacterium]
MATLRKRLQQSIEIERMAMEFYQTVAGRFPDTPIWQELELSEREHLAIMEEVARSWPM